MRPTLDQDRFWQWFANNNERLQAAVYGNDSPAREKAMGELAEVSKEAAPGLVLEICKGRGGQGARVDTFWGRYRSFCRSPGSDELEEH